MSILCSDGRFASAFSRVLHASQCKSGHDFTRVERSQATTNKTIAARRRLLCSAVLLGLLACLCFGQTTPVLAQMATQQPARDAYTVADAYAYADIPKPFFPDDDKTRTTFRVRNLKDKRHAIWGDPFYPDQILLGAPRTYELAAAFNW
jgi:hypothetical protein